MDYLLHIATVILLNAGLVVTLNLLIGHAGIFSFAHASFYGIGAYATAMLTAYAGWNWFPAVFAAIVSGGLISLVIGIPTLRLSGDYFILALFGFQLIIVNLILNLEDLTNGPFGIRGIPRPSIGGHVVQSGWPMLLATAFVTSIVFVIVRLIISSPLGAKLHAIRDDETVAAALGIDVELTRIIVFTVAGGLAALMGAMAAFYFRFVEASAFTTAVMILLLAMAFVGGIRSMLGAIVGPAILIIFPELFRFIGPIEVDISRIQEALYGLLLVLLMLYRPQGITGPTMKGGER